MRLVVFDIDDTLTRTMEVDGECFLQTVEEQLGLDTSQLRWSEFPHVTDTGLLDVLFRKARGNPPTLGEHDRFLARFFQVLQAEHGRNPHRFRAIPGAREILTTLRNSDQWCVALATGAWFRTARFKLLAAGIDPDGLPFATSDDHHTRAGIVTRAIRRAEEAAGLTEGFDAIVAVGDGAWDVATASELGLSFIGVGPPERLADIGAQVGVGDYTDPGTFFSLLEQATTGQ
ncbi:MAG: HAD family hydrolase [Gemmatimonadetes bacterium]|nr:HAD family hydrolase [Gemmatimonadota bacterium]